MHGMHATRASPHALAPHTDILIQPQVTSWRLSPVQLAAAMMHHHMPMSGAHCITSLPPASAQQQQQEMLSQPNCSQQRARACTSLQGGRQQHRGALPAVSGASACCELGSAGSGSRARCCAASRCQHEQQQLPCGAVRATGELHVVQLPRSLPGPAQVLW